MASFSYDPSFIILVNTLKTIESTIVRYELSVAFARKRFIVKEK